MKRPSSIFSFDTLRPPRRLPRAALLAVALLVAAELAVRACVRHGALRPAPSMYSLIEGNVARLRTQRAQRAQQARAKAGYDVWLLGNSTLAFGVDEQAFGRLTGCNAISMPHGSATPRALAALADYYLARGARPPQAIVVFATEADFNANGYRAKASRGYLDYVAGRRWQPQDHVMLFATRESLVRRLLAALPESLRADTGATATEDDDDEGHQSSTGPIPRFTGRVIPGRNTFHNALVQRYRFDTGALDLLASVARRHGVPHVAVVVVPVTDVHRRFFDSKLPNLTCAQVRRIAADESAKRGLTFIDTSDAVQAYTYFADDYHMNRDGRAIYTDKLAAMYTNAVASAAPLAVETDEAKPAPKNKSHKSRSKAPS